MSSPETWFLVCNYGVLPFWVLLAVAPRAAITRQVVHAAWITWLLATVYLVALASGSSEGGSFASLHGVMTLLSSPHAALAGWVHYLVFDLFVGAWEVRDAQRHAIPHAAVVPCLFATLMLGPLGLAAYLLLRSVLRRRVSLDESTAPTTRG